MFSHRKADKGRVPAWVWTGLCGLCFALASGIAAAVTGERQAAQPGDEVVTTGQPDAAPNAATPATPGEMLLEHAYPELNARLRGLLDELAQRPDDPALRARLDDLLRLLLAVADAHGDIGDVQGMGDLLGLVRSIDPGHAGLGQATRRMAALGRVDDWLARASRALAAGRLIEPEHDNALRYLRGVLAVDPRNEAAGRGLLGVQQGLVERALAAARELDFELAMEWLDAAAEVRGPQDLVDDAREEIEAFRTREADRIEGVVGDAILAREFARAEIMLIDLIALGGSEQRVAELRARMEDARLYGHYRPGQVFSDALAAGGSGPELVVIPAGSFMMGSPEEERGRAVHEGPRHRVTITQGFAIGRTEVTVAQFRAFAEATRYRTGAEKEGISVVFIARSGRLAEREGVNWRHGYAGRPADEGAPVLHLDWHDAQAYLLWLSRQTGQRYRLPSEAEFEYVLRAGSITAYWWGNGSPGQRVENLTGEGDRSDDGRQWTASFSGYEDGHWGPAPVASFAPNPLGVHDLAGNVSEWVTDCWHSTYIRAPDDGSAWDNPGCQRRTVRGGYWAAGPDQARSAARLSADSHLTGPRVGFRVVREL
ncbi:MAG: SUMF1/EgtB/PvdO family nonheme iron enzyme [Xanthomonadales bacterium]|nr:SUMF1/EgtB/PvdO family nonheme iron enzyme [Xanthomonadales bacterium]NIT46204.1 SUMF1/EgtB/PvdO family nonheme iron enzyme [Stutzerimonas stutzeri]NIN59884.1 SUMF1/EgtB/PvdO family nonheme iron enzyme [Xanthomonadales bacterium]NIN75258.1 SUMF1/EgtB/PvdO family nonheme iron enzyme [Xanthomonadales bacterium]NIO15127.1 SUMF1/EgtB/PvdO family nonheme iron enzyme [Xanthomonadales bacterium]